MAYVKRQHRYVPLILEIHEIEENATVLFWMDTLCIPVGLENVALRVEAINRMDLTYAGARVVLVLDPELQRISREGLTQEQLCAHVLCSSWMNRCWTLQEARLSSNWVVQFADGIFNPRTAEERLYEGRADANRTLSWNDTK